MRPIKYVSGSSTVIHVDVDTGGLLIRSKGGTMNNIIVNRETIVTLHDALSLALQEWPKSKNTNTEAPDHPLTGQMEEWMNKDAEDDGA